MITPKMTFYPLGNADTTRIDLRDERTMLVDYADMRCSSDPTDRRIDLPSELRRHMTAVARSKFEIVAFTHLDKDHTCGASDFFWWDHASCYQGPGRFPVGELWVPAAAVTESGLDDCARVIREEAKFRLRQGYGVRVFSRPDALKGTLAKWGLSLSDRRNLITNAGECVPGFSKDGVEGVEFFAHSPFGWRRNEREVDDRNQDSLVFQVTFKEGLRETRALFTADAPHDALAQIVKTSDTHGNLDRLKWDVMKVSHHSSYLSLSAEKGEDETVPVAEVEWLFEKGGLARSIMISSSYPIPAKGTPEDDDYQPPHRQAAHYYRKVRDQLDGEFAVTMDRPTRSKPRPTEVIVGVDGAKLVSATIPATVAVTSTGVRAG